MISEKVWSKCARDIYAKWESWINDNGSDGEKRGEYALLTGPGHVVWSDQNYEDSTIDWCLSWGEEQRFALYRDMMESEFQAAMISLRELRMLPEGMRVNQKVT
jgi:hypothetical protein